MPSYTDKPMSRPPAAPASLALWNFSSQWFLVPQGSGIIAVILHQLDYQFRGLKILSQIVWVYTIVLLALCLFFYLLRIILYPRHVARVLRTSLAETSCLSCISITFTSIIQMVVLTLVSDWGSGWSLVAYVLWWTNTGMAVIACIVIPYVFIKLQPPGIKGVTPAVLMPLIAALTSAAGGAIICQFGGLSAELQVPTIIVSYLEVGMGLSLAVAFDNIFLARLFDKSFLPLDQIHQGMVLCGPFGQGSFALQALGLAVQRGSFAAYRRGTFLTEQAAASIGFASQFLGLLAWGYGTFWWSFAIISNFHTFIAQPGGIRKSKFTMSAWALVFPWGVYTNAAVNLGKIMDSTAFKVWSTALLLLLLVIWLVNQILTIKGLITGKLLGLDHGWRRNAYVCNSIHREV
ncbi:hypothetical protein VTO42DRAFT_5488 [Malbranchea cinnamomea]